MSYRTLVANLYGGKTSKYGHLYRLAGWTIAGLYVGSLIARIRLPEYSLAINSVHTRPIDWFPTRTNNR